MINIYLFAALWLQWTLFFSFTQSTFTCQNDGAFFTFWKQTWAKTQPDRSFVNRVAACWPLVAEGNPTWCLLNAGALWGSLKSSCWPSAPHSLNLYRLLSEAAHRSDVWLGNYRMWNLMQGKVCQQQQEGNRSLSFIKAVISISNVIYLQIWE